MKKILIVAIAVLGFGMQASALDIKALYMGVTGVGWEETSHNAISQQLGLPTNLEHHALQDALDQAILFRKILELK